MPKRTTTSNGHTGWQSAIQQIVPVEQYSVLIEYDGCCNEPASHTSDYDSCITYIRTHRAPKHCEWALRNDQSGRLVSYVY